MTLHAAQTREKALFGRRMLMERKKADVLEIQEADAALTIE